MAWCFEDEATASSRDLLVSLATIRCHVPVLWRLEVGNVLLQAERRGRLSARDSLEFIELLSWLPINVDNETDGRLVSDILPIARRHRLTSYDAAYLELALRLDLPLATRDADLARAARVERVGLVPA